MDADGELGDVGGLTVCSAQEEPEETTAPPPPAPAPAPAPVTEPAPAETLPRSGADTGMLGPAIAALALAAGIAAIRRRLG